MVDTVYSNKLSFGELIINYLNDKANTKFNVRDFNWEPIGSQLNENNNDDEEYKCQYKITHRRQDLFPGEHIIELQYHPNSKRTLVKVQPPLLIHANSMTKEDCHFPYTETYETYTKNKGVEYKQVAGLSARGTELEPELNHVDQPTIIINDFDSKETFIDVEEPIYTCLTKPLKDENYNMFLYSTKCIIRHTLEPIINDSNRKTFINLNASFKEKLICYFKQNWGEDWSGKKEGWNFDNCYHLKTIQDPNSPTKDFYHILYFQPNGIRPCGIFFLVDRYTSNENEDFPIWLTSEGDSNRTNILELLCNLLDNLAEYIPIGDMLYRLIYKGSYPESTYRLCDTMSVMPIIEYTLRYGISQLKGDYNSTNCGTYYDTKTDSWYMTKINNPKLDKFDFTQLRFKTEGFDISRILPKNLIVKKSDLDDQSIDIRKVIFNKTNIMLPSEDEGLHVEYIDSNDSVTASGYRFTVMHGLATIIFKKGSTLFVPIVL